MNKSITRAHCLFAILLFVLFTNNLEAQKSYHYAYYSDGSIKEEGWKIEETKIDYWISYFPNGQVAQKGHFKNNQRDGYWYFFSEEGKLEKEGHFKNDQADYWWTFYDFEAQIIRKYQYENNKKEGYCLLYKQDTLFKVERFKNDQKTGEWTDILSFKKDNPNTPQWIQ